MVNVRIDIIPVLISIVILLMESLDYQIMGQDGWDGGRFLWWLGVVYKS